MSEDFDLMTAAAVFLTYVVIDVLYAWYIIAVGKSKALVAASLSSVIYSLLAFGILAYAKNIVYLAPLAAGAFVGTFIVVTFHKAKTK